MPAKSQSISFTLLWLKVVLADAKLLPLLLLQTSLFHAW